VHVPGQNNGDWSRGELQTVIFCVQKINANASRK